MTANGAPAPCIDPAGLARLHEQLAAFGATPRGGVNRPALSDADIAARLWVIEQARGIDCAVATDPLGNLFLRLEGSEPSLPPVLTGSHTDTQPSGGRYDGAYGVLAGLAALQALHRSGVRPRRSIETVVWTNEEGCRFAPGCMGSLGFAYPEQRERLLAVADRDGTTISAALAAWREAAACLPQRELGFPVAAFVEAHIEQGPVLEAEGKTIGLVTTIQGKRRFEVTVAGEDAHAGTTPRAARRDALSAAARMVTALEASVADPEDVARFTIGRFEVGPGSHAVVPSKVVFSIDFRHPDRGYLVEKGDAFIHICREAAGRCEVAVHEIGFTPPVAFEGLVPEAIERAVRRSGLSWMRILSGAGHDAQHLATRCPTGIIFVPCERGISHNETENARPEDLVSGATILLDVLIELSNR